MGKIKTEKDLLLGFTSLERCCYPTHLLLSSENIAVQGFTVNRRKIVNATCSAEIVQTTKLFYVSDYAKQSVTS